MAYVSSMTYTTEAQFLEAVAQAKAAQTTRANAQHTETVSFQQILDSSTSAYTASTASPDTLEAYFQKAADTYGISVELLKAVAKQESGFQTNVVSSAGAIGVMQLMPATASYLGVENPYDPDQNIMGGAKLLAELSSRYQGDINLILAAYNAGTGAVDQYGTVPPFSETQSFVSRIKETLGILSSSINDDNSASA